MNSTLGRKQRTSNADWVRTFENIEDIVPRKEVERLTKQTLAEIQKKTKGKKAAYAWSGGNLQDGRYYALRACEVRFRVSGVSGMAGSA